MEEINYKVGDKIKVKSTITEEDWFKVGIFWSIDEILEKDQYAIKIEEASA